MAQTAFCFLCEQDVPSRPDGTLRDHQRPHPGGPTVVAISRCAGSGLSQSTTRTLAAHAALRRP